MKSYIMNLMFVWWSWALPGRWLLLLPWYLVSHSTNLQLESILELTSFSNYPLFILLPFNPFTSWSSQAVLVVKSRPANAGDLRDVSLIPGLRRSPGGGQHNALQYFCLENPMDRGAWRATVHGLAKSWTRLEQLSTHANPLNSQHCPPSAATCLWMAPKNLRTVGRIQELLTSKKSRILFFS